LRRRWRRRGCRGLRGHSLLLRQCRSLLLGKSRLLLLGKLCLLLR
jgi:hypothetical protein